MIAGQAHRRAKNHVLVIPHKRFEWCGVCHGRLAIFAQQVLRPARFFDNDITHFSLISEHGGGADCFKNRAEKRAKKIPQTFRCVLPEGVIML